MTSRRPSAPLSIVIPALNAGDTLAATLASLQEGKASGLVREIIVSDGGSTDGTQAIARAAGARVIEGPKGRGRQLIAGAYAANAPWLLFLHADTVLEPGWAGIASRFLWNGPQKAAAFGFAFDERTPAARRIQFFVDVRCALFKLPYGDQGLLISRELYGALGGYRPMPLMEDVDLVRRIGPRRLSILPVRAVTSAAKYRRDGFQRRAWRNLWLLTRFFLGADPAKLAKAYA